MPRSLPFNRHSNFSSCVRLCTSLVDNLCKHISKLVKIDLASLLCSCYSSRFPHYELCPGTLNTLIFLLVWNHTQLFDMLSLIRHSISINICQCMHPIWMETRRTQIVQTPPIPSPRTIKQPSQGYSLIPMYNPPSSQSQGSPTPPEKSQTTSKIENSLK